MDETRRSRRGAKVRLSKRGKEDDRWPIRDSLFALALQRPPHPAAGRSRPESPRKADKGRVAQPPGLGDPVERGDSQVVAGFCLARFLPWHRRPPPRLASFGATTIRHSPLAPLLVRGMPVQFGGSEEVDDEAVRRASSSSSSSSSESEDDEPAVEAGEPIDCLVCRNKPTSYAPLGCGHESLCKGCAMKQATGGKCKVLSSSSYCAVWSKSELTEVRRRSAATCSTRSRRSDDDLPPSCDVSSIKSDIACRRPKQEPRQDQGHRQMLFLES